MFAQNATGTRRAAVGIRVQQREETALGGLLCEPLGYRWRPLRQLELASVDFGKPCFRAPSDVA